MNTSPIAVIDMGTNTFHILIGHPGASKVEVLYTEKVAVGLGKGGISEGKITAEAMERALRALEGFKEKIKGYAIQDADVIITGTSAVRQARNNWELISRIELELGWKVRVLDGNQEATLIFKGVLHALDMPLQRALVVDIGGGSVEFMIGEGDQLVWKKSVEIGGQRLMDKFHHSDPIAHSEQEALKDYLEESLTEVAHAIFTYKPEVFIGSSGSFDTLAEMNMQYHQLNVSIDEMTMYRIPMSDYKRMRDELLRSTRAERLQIPGMIPLRADMIVVAIILLDYIFDCLEPHEIVVSTYALKEGVLYAAVEEGL